MSNRLGGKQGTAYTGTNANQPPNITFHERDPDQNNNSNVAVGDLWLNTVAKTLWYLASLAGNPTSRGSLASWIQVNSGSSTVVDSLTGNSGGAVGPDVNGNINVLGDTTTINIVGNPGTNTLTASAGATIATTFAGDTGTATPAANTINFNATPTAGSSVSFSASGSTVALNVTDANDNTIIGNNAGNGTLSGINNTALGEGAAASLTTGPSNIFIGKDAGSVLTTESATLYIGHVGIAGENNQIVIAEGNGGARWAHNFGGTFLGRVAGNFTYTGTGGMTGVGENCLESVTTATDCTCVGQTAGQMITTGSSNCIMGKDSAALLTTGASNTLLGQSVAYNGVTGLTTGSNSILIGRAAGSGYTAAESNNIIIGTNNTGVTGETRTIRMGFGGVTNNRCFIDGIRGITTGVNDAVPVLIDSAGQLGTTSSSLRYKMNVEDMGSKSEAILQARPVTFNYKYQGLKSNYGLIAEELHEIMPELVVYDKEGNPDTIKYHEMPAILLNELQKLSKRVEELEKRVAL